jgi:pyruvate dehydrogenase E1 component beta subunit
MMPERTFETEIFRAIADEMRDDERIILLSTNPPTSLLTEFGPSRVRSTPIAESAMTGIAVGAAGCGLRPIVFWGNVTFSFVAWDQIVNQAARIRYMCGGQRNFPMVFYARYSNGRRSAAQHSQSGLAFYAHAAGLKVVAPSQANEAGPLMGAAIRDENPVVYIHADRLSSRVAEAPCPDHESLHGSSVVIEGRDVSIVSVGYTTQLAVSASERLAALGVSAEVVDVRWVVPLDVGTICRSVMKTGRLVVVDESFPTCSVASEVVASVVSTAGGFGALKSPPARVCTASVPVPFSPQLEDFVLPDVEDIVRATQAVL